MSNLAGIICVGLVVVLCAVALFLLNRHINNYIETLEESSKELLAKKSRICSYSLERAKQLAIEALSRSEEFDVVLNDKTDVERLAALAPLQREFFTRYREVRSSAEHQLSLEDFEPWGRTPGFLKIGTDEDGDNLYLVTTGREEIYLVDGFAKRGEPYYEPQLEAPSIYHMVVLLSSHYGSDE